MGKKPVSRKEMKKLVASVCAVLFILPCAFGSQEPYGGIRLLQGYTINRTWAVDVDAWTIERKGGLRIGFEAGFS